MLFRIHGLCFTFVSGGCVPLMLTDSEASPFLGSWSLGNPEIPHKFMDIPYKEWATHRKIWELPL